MSLRRVKQAVQHCGPIIVSSRPFSTATSNSNATSSYFLAASTSTLTYLVHAIFPFGHGDHVAEGLPTPAAVARITASAEADAHIAAHITIYGSGSLHVVATIAISVTLAQLIAEEH